MPVAVVTKGTRLYPDDATLNRMDHPDNLSPPTGPLSPDDDPFIDEQRKKKIDHLQQVVADGTYFVSAEQLADKLIEHMMEPKS